MGCVSVEQIATELSAKNLSLRHILVVAGTVGEWADLSNDAWQQRVNGLGEMCAAFGVRWLTMRPYELGDDASDAGAPAWQQDVDGSTVAIDPTADGRQRFADAMARLPTDEQVNEASVAAVLYEPADSEPDLVIVFGPSHKLPPSLVWELAYAELVFRPTAWTDLSAGDVAVAIAEFSNRRRRFGGLDEES